MAYVHRYHRRLLDNAREAIIRGEYQLSVVLSQVACEVCTELVFETLFYQRGVTGLKALIFSGPSTFNLQNDRIYKYYIALGGRSIDKHTTSWKAYTDHVKRRNDLVHRGSQVTEEEARNSYNAVCELIQKLEALFPQVAP